MDCAGHGTHVAGIIAAENEIVVGVAPQGKKSTRIQRAIVRFSLFTADRVHIFLPATLGAYRVLGCSGSSNDDVILAALERAVTDRMDVINLSLGEPNGWPGNTVAQAISKIKSFGIMVTVSHGNDNTQGLFSANYVGEGSSVLSVASYINTRDLLNYFTVPTLPNYRFCTCANNVHPSASTSFFLCSLDFFWDFPCLLPC